MKLLINNIILYKWKKNQMLFIIQILLLKNWIISRIKKYNIWKKNKTLLKKNLILFKNKMFKIMKISLQMKIKTKINKKLL